MLPEKYQIQSYWLYSTNLDKQAKWNRWQYSRQKAAVSVRRLSLPTVQHNEERSKKTGSEKRRATQFAFGNKDFMFNIKDYHLQEPKYWSEKNLNTMKGRANTTTVNPRWIVQQFFRSIVNSAVALALPKSDAVYHTNDNRTKAPKIT